MSEKGRVTDAKVNRRWAKHKKRWVTKVERNCEVKADEQPHNKRKKNLESSPPPKTDR